MPDDAIQRRRAQQLLRRIAERLHLAIDAPGAAFMGPDDVRELFQCLVGFGLRGSAARLAREYRDVCLGSEFDRLVNTFRDSDPSLYDMIQVNCGPTRQFERAEDEEVFVAGRRALFSGFTDELLVAIDNGSVDGDGGQGGADDGDEWVTASRIVAKRYVTNEGRLTKLAKRHTSIRRTATDEDRRRLDNDSIRYVYNARLIYELTEGAAKD